MNLADDANILSSNLTVSEIWRYPVKSMGGEALEQADVGPHGLTFDRGWAVRDEKSGAIRGGRYIPQLLMCSARYLAETSAGLVPHVEITLPEGIVVNSDDPRANRLLSDAMGRKLSLVPIASMGPVDQGAGNFETESLDSELRMMFGLASDEAIPDMALLSDEISRASEMRGTYADLFPVDMLTTSSLRHLQGLLPDSELPTRRFRPNFVIDDHGKSAALREREWIGGTIRLGTAEIAVMADCIRCTMVAAAQPGLAKDTRITRTLVRELNQRFSVYCNVTKSGTVRLADNATPLLPDTSAA